MFLQPFRLTHKLYAANVKYFSTVSLKNPVISSPAKLKSWKKIPGPSTLPVIGQLHHFLPGGSLYKNEGYNLWNHLYNTYGHIVRVESILKPTVLVLYDPERIAEILHAENSVPVRAAMFSLKYFRMEHNRKKDEPQRLGGFMVYQGEDWKDLRMKVNPVLMKPKIIDQYKDSIDEVAADMVERIKLVRDGNNMIRESFQKEINLWSLESIGVIALGRRLNGLDPNLDQNSPLMTLIRCTHGLFEVSHKMDFKPSLWKYYATPTFKRAMKIYEDLESSTSHYVNMAIRDIKAEGHRLESEKSVLEKLLEIDENVAKIMATDMLVAGVDTVTNTLLFTLYLLAKHPEKQQKVREEISSKGKRAYLKACVKESMRVMPTTGLNYRVTTKEHQILGYTIPKHMGIVFCHHVVGLLDSNFPKAKEFIPERWVVKEDHPLHYRRTNPFAYLPFGFGVRSCLGRRIAEMEIEALLERLVETFQVDWVGPPPNITFSHINYMKGPYNFVFNNVKK